MPYTWDVKEHKYRDDLDNFVDHSLVRNYLNLSLASTVQVSDLLSSLVYNGNISLADFYSIGREEMKREYLRLYMLAVGGKSQMTYSDYGRVGAMLKEQYKYFNGFLQDIAAGNLSEAQIRARLNMYFNSAREAYEKAHAKQAKEWGAVEERWNVTNGIENCPDCLAYESEGWKPFGYFPVIGSGSTVCLTACKCWKEYRNAQGKIYYE
jgi:hypothetical protein